MEKAYTPTKEEAERFEKYKNYLDSQRQEKPEMVEVIQINLGKKRYFCKTPKEQSVFDEIHLPSKEKYESYKIELPDYIAKDYLDNSENKKAFERKTA